MFDVMFLEICRSIPTAPCISMAALKCGSTVKIVGALVLSPRVGGGRGFPGVVSAYDGLVTMNVCWFSPFW